MTDSHGTTAYTYDSRDRLQTVTRNGSTISYAYDAAGNLTELTYPDGTVLNYTYNSLNLSTTATEMTNTLNVSYDSCGRRNSETIPNDINVTYQYDANGRLTLVRHQLAETVLAQTGYTLDNNGNRLSIQDEQSRLTNFTYDDLNQLSQAAYPDNTSIDYFYDAVGNRRTMTGNIPADLDNTNAGYQYDYEDRLTSVTDAEKTINYIYDGDGNLIGKTITTGTTTETYEYIYDYSAGLPRVLVEKKNGTEIFDYFYLGRLYARKGSEGTIYYQQDGLGSTLAITDASGNVLNKYTYDAFGTPKAIKETAANSILFTGEPYDASGLYYLRARYYDPATGRFITQDTLFGEMDNPLTQNLYVYCGNNPVLYVDSSGHVRRCTLAGFTNNQQESKEYNEAFKTLNDILNKQYPGAFLRFKQKDKINNVLVNHKDLIKEAAQKYGVPSEIIAGIIVKEQITQSIPDSIAVIDTILSDGKRKHSVGLGAVFPLTAQKSWLAVDPREGYINGIFEDEIMVQISLATDDELSIKTVSVVAAYYAQQKFKTDDVSKLSMEQWKEAVGRYNASDENSKAQNKYSEYVYQYLEPLKIILE